MNPLVISPTNSALSTSSSRKGSAEACSSPSSEAWRGARRRWIRCGVAAFLGVFLAASTHSIPSRAAQAPPEGASLARANPITRIGQNTLDGFSGYNLVLHALGMAATPVLVFTGADAEAHDAFARHQTLEPYSAAGVYLGYGLPLLVGGGLMTAGLVADSQREVVAASAALQATVLALGYQSVLKAFTGRTAPPEGVVGSDAASEEFRFGFLRGGIHYGWPSGHMMTTTAIYASLIEVYSESLPLKLGGGAVVAGMFSSVAIHEGSSMHWLSDMVAGTLMGLAIGRGVGAGFAGLAPKDAAALGQLSVGPLLGVYGARGVSLSGAF